MMTFFAKILSIVHPVHVALEKQPIIFSLSVLYIMLFVRICLKPYRKYVILHWVYCCMETTLQAVIQTNILLMQSMLLLVTRGDFHRLRQPLVPQFCIYSLLDSKPLTSLIFFFQLSPFHLLIIHIYHYFISSVFLLYNYNAKLACADLFNVTSWVAHLFPYLFYLVCT